MRAFTQQCDLVIAPSEGLAQVMHTEWGIKSRVVVVPNGIDVEPFRVDRVGVDRLALGLPIDQPVAIFTGRLGAEKNVGFLIRAYARALPEPGKGHLLLIGDGPRSARLRELAARLGVAERVTFAGAVPRERIPNMLAAADFFATASTTEVHPLSVLEALAAGLPVVGTVSPGVADTITHGIDGLLTAPDLSQYAEALRDLYADQNLRSRLSRGARETGARYDIGNTTSRLLGLYRRALSGSRPAGASCD
jgi:glycosyltransferase involved in cell wall biosynthesis